MSSQSPEIFAKFQIQDHKIPTSRAWDRIVGEMGVAGSFAAAIKRRRGRRTPPLTVGKVDI